MNTWEETMWAEIKAHPETDQIGICGDWITRMQQIIVPALARLRRETVLGLLAGEGMDATRLAETIGARRTTIIRLAEEGRALRREENIREAAEYAGRVGGINP
jgi:hypothetical protein